MRLVHPSLTLGLVLLTAACPNPGTPSNSSGSSGANNQAQSSSTQVAQSGSTGSSSTTLTTSSAAGSGGTSAPVATSQVTSSGSTASGASSSAAPAEVCGNGTDDDADSLADCADADCSSLPGCTLDPDCDGLDAAAETAANTDPADADSDNDGLTDGVELGITQPVAGAHCALVLVDTHPASTTRPDLADTDGDQIPDGAEDANLNGAVDTSESNPRLTDSDGDGLGDGVEDADHDGVKDSEETSAAAWDTDGDGVGDGVELGITLTNPLDPDSDADGLPDGVEDTNQDGVVGPAETNANAADSDNDGLMDGVEDANHNGTQDVGETSPLRADTDGDGLPDGAEDLNGNGMVDAAETDPRTPDTDADGLTDADEGVRMTDPTHADSDLDGFPDGDEVAFGSDPLANTDPPPPELAGALAACTAANATPLMVLMDTRLASADADWALAVPAYFGPQGVPTAANGMLTAATFDDHADPALAQTHGFVLALPQPDVSSDPLAQAQQLINRLVLGGAELGGMTTVLSAGTRVTGLSQARDVEVRMTLGMAADAGTVRNRVLGVLAGQNAADLSNLPLASTDVDTVHRVKLVVELRGGALRQMVVAGAVVSETSFLDGASLARVHLDEVSGGTGLARAHSPLARGCVPHDVPARRADFIWMADISGSTDDDRGTIVTATSTLFTALQDNNVDFRMGVVPHSFNIRGAVPANAGLLRSGFTRDALTFVADLQNTTQQDGCEFGLTAADNAITRALPRTALGTEDPLKLRADAKLVVFYIADETAQEIEMNTCGLGNLGTGQTDATRVIPNAAQQAAINNIVAPFVSRILANDGVAFGQLTPTDAPFCAGNAESGRGYLDVVNATGGSAYRVCDSDPGAALDQMVAALFGDAGGVVLADVPVAASLKVSLVRAGTTTALPVPKSAVDGFTYAASTNGLSFHGTTLRPAAGDTLVVGYQRFGAPPPAPPSCAAPLVLNPASNTCECSADCGVSGGCASPGAVCNRDAVVCACECKDDCGGACTGTWECGGAQAMCGCVCGDADNDGTVDCNTLNPGALVCNPQTCTLE